MKLYTIWVILSIILLNIMEGYVGGSTSAADYKFLFADKQPTKTDILNLRSSMEQTSQTWMILLLVPMILFLFIAGRSVAKAIRSFKKPGLG